MRRTAEIQAQLDEFREDRLQLKKLVEYVGWQRYVKILENQIKLLRNDTEAPLDSLLHIPAREHALGQIFGMRTAIDFPVIQAEVLDSDIERLQKEMEHAEALEKADRDRGE